MLRSLLCLSLSCAAIGGAEPPEFDYRIEWIGSAYKKGDAFVVTADIGETQVLLKWDGFAGAAFDFMDEAKKERTQQVIRFDDRATVEAFRALAEHSEWADVGGPHALGQGVSVEATVRGAEGAVLREMYYFGTPQEFVVAQRFERIPWKAESMVGAEGDSAKATFSKELQDFGNELRTAGGFLASLRKAHDAGGGFPHGEFAGVARVPEYREFLKRYGTEWSPAPDAVDELVGLAGAALKDCMHPARRLAILGKGTSKGGCLVRIDEMAMGETLGNSVSVAVARLPQAARSPHYLALSAQAEELLLRFIAGGEPVGRMPAPVTCRLDVDPQGRLTVIESPRWFGGGELELSSGMKARLKWLNSQNVADALASRITGGDQPLLGMVHFSSIRFHPEDKERVKFDYSFRGGRYVVEARLEDGEWTPGKRWNRDDYYQVDGVYHNDRDFREE